MKKIFIILAIAIIAINANAQWFLGGNIGFYVHIEGAQNELNPCQSEIGFSIAPKFGYYFNEKFAFGVDLAAGPTFAQGVETYTWYDGWGYPHVSLSEFQGTFVHWRVSPFLRYSIFNHKKFTLMLEGSMGAGAQHFIIEYERQPQPLKYSVIGVGILNLVPILGYKLNDHIQLEAELNFLNIGYNLDIHLNGGVTELKHDFNIGFYAKNVFSVSQLRIGMIYKF
jgi:hypothetical protein